MLLFLVVPFLFFSVFFFLTTPVPFRWLAEECPILGHGPKIWSDMDGDARERKRPNVSHQLRATVWILMSCNVVKGLLWEVDTEVAGGKDEDHKSKRTVYMARRRRRRGLKVEGEGVWE